MDAYAIVGLGNPGPRYARTRHNIGFDVLNLMSQQYQVKFNQSRFDALFGDITIDERRVFFVKPLTFMNLSGKAVASFIHYLDLPLSQLLVVCDDLDLPLGQIRLRRKGGAGGHKGLISINENLGTQDYARLRLGVGRPSSLTTDREEVVDHVLSSFNRTELEKIEAALEGAVEAVKVWLLEGIEPAMNHFNQKLE